MIWILYNLIFALGFTLLLPKFLLHMRRRGGYWPDFWQRIGRYSPQTKARLAEGGRFWVHGVSVGEVFVALKFMDEVRRRKPETRFVLSVTTSTGNRLARERIDPRDVVVYFPVDCPFLMDRILNLIKPCALALIETEIWPNLILRANRRGIPIYTINGRMSDSSYRGYRILRPFTARLLPRFERVFVQSGADRERYMALGAPPDKITVTGSAKYETAAVSDDAARRGREILAALGCAPDTPILLGASTWSGEEKLLLDIFIDRRRSHPELLLILAPRHAERREEVLELIRPRGLKVATRRDMIAAPDQNRDDADIFLLDTTGELSFFYRHAAIVFVGKSLSHHGGQNPIEPAACGKAVLVGPNMENFRIVMKDLLEAEAIIQVEDREELARSIAGLLADSAKRAEYGERALQVVAAKRGAIRRTVELMDMN